MCKSHSSNLSKKDRRVIERVNCIFYSPYLLQYFFPQNKTKTNLKPKDLHTSTRNMVSRDLQTLTFQRKPAFASQGITLHVVIALKKIKPSATDRSGRAKKLLSWSGCVALSLCILLLIYTKIVSLSDALLGPTKVK